MKGVKFSKFFIKRTIKYSLISLITCITTIGIYFYYKGVAVFNPFSSLFGEKKLYVKLDTTVKEVNKLVNNVRLAFNFYFKSCKKFDEIQPRIRKCRKTVGFHASVLESLETLYLLGMKEEYQKAIDFVANNFNCSKLEWVNRAEFWSRGVGSLIGAYTVSKNKLFLNTAEECAAAMLSAEETDTDKAFTFVNIKKQEGKRRIWTKGNSITDIVAGLPELSALYKITKKTKYEDAIESILSRIPTQESRVAPFYDDSGNKIYNPEFNDGYITSFFYNTISALLLKENIDMLTFISEAAATVQTNIQKYPNINFPLLDVSHYLDIGELPTIIPVEDDLYDYVKKNYSRPIYSAISLDKGIYDLGFNFEGAALRALARECSDNNKDYITLLKVVNEGFIRGKVGSGFSGIRKSSSLNQDTSLNYIMSSNIFGQWASVGALAASGNIRYINTSVINERGHILSLDFTDKK